MTSPQFSRPCLVAAVALMATWCGLVAAPAAPPVPGNPVQATQILTRGPVHEAFAETVTFDPEPGLVVARAPPAAIDELPPEQKPEGDNVAWIPGYWAWDDDSNNFLWVSGVWRALPPGRQWVPGYWAESGDGAQWISGYWADARLTEAEYLPEPPETVEAGPSVAAPSADSTWLPGSWVWQQNRYSWRPGFWSAVYPDWDWTPAHYQWTPRGYVYVDGYWDHSIGRRGVLFAPVTFAQSVYSQEGFSYTPSTVIDLGVFANHLFLRPNYGHYYYGDYYGANYATTGFYPSYSYNTGRHGYDPIFAHQRWNHRNDRDWDRRVKSDFQHRRDNEDARPPRTFAAQQALATKGLTGADKGRVFAQPLDQFTKSREGGMRFQQVNNDDRKQFGKLGQESRTAREERQRLEARANDPATERPTKTTEPARGKLPRSPFVAKGADQPGNDQGPPKAHEYPKPDPKIVPKARQPVAGRTPRTELPPARVEPKTSPNAEPRPQPVAPKPQPQPVAPRAQPVAPKVEPVAPKPQPQPVTPRAQPEAPKAQPVAPKPQPVTPRAQPVAPKVQPVAPRPQPQPAAPKVQPTAPKPQPVAPKAVQPVAPRPQPPKAQPVSPKPEPPKNEQPRAGNPEKPGRGPKEPRS